MKEYYIKWQFLPYNTVYMKIKTVIHAPESAKEVVDRLSKENISWKLDAYLKKFKNPEAEGLIDIKVDKAKDGKFDGKLQATLDGKKFHFERNWYENLDNLVFLSSYGKKFIEYVKIN